LRKNLGELSIQSWVLGARGVDGGCYGEGAGGEGGRIEEGDVKLLLFAVFGHIFDGGAVRVWLLFNSLLLHDVSGEILVVSSIVGSFGRCVSNEANRARSSFSFGYCFGTLILASFWCACSLRFLLLVRLRPLHKRRLCLRKADLFLKRSLFSLLKLNLLGLQVLFASCKLLLIASDLYDQLGDQLLLELLLLSHLLGFLRPFPVRLHHELHDLLELLFDG
jgi:hypothetical protein